MRNPLAIALCFLLLPATSLAQRRHSRLAVSTVYSLDAGGPLSPVQTVGYFGLRIDYQAPVLVAPGAQVDYTVGVVPLALVLRNPLGRTFPFHGRWALSGTAARTTTYGAGLLPLGLRVGFFPAALMAPVLHASAGFLVFARPAPAANSDRFNLAAELGLGIRARLAGGRHLACGIAFQHFSNAGLGEANPGLDSKLVYGRVSVPF